MTGTTSTSLRPEGGGLMAIAPDMTLSEACALMRSHGAATLAVCEGGALIGVLSERDVIRHWDRAAASGFTLPVSVILTDGAGELANDAWPIPAQAGGLAAQ